MGNEYFEAKGVSREEFDALKRFGNYEELSHGTLMRMEGDKEFRIYREDSGWLIAGSDGPGVIVTRGFGNSSAQLGQIYVYVGEKQEDTGNEIEKAGLHGGSFYGIRIVLGGISQPLEQRETWITNGNFELQKIPDPGMDPMDSEFDDVREMTGAQIQSSSSRKLVTEFLRPEDGAWDTRDPNVFYFLTTDRYDMTKDRTGIQIGRSRLHRLTFNNIQKPEEGGRYEVLLDGTEDQQMLDNMTVDGDGNLILQEDPGNQALLARIWKYYPRSDELVEIAKHDPELWSANTTIDSG